MKEKKKKENTLNKRALLLTLSVFTTMAIIAIIMNMIMSAEDAKNAQSAREAASKQSIATDDGLTSVSGKAQAVTADALPAAATDTPPAENTKENTNTENDNAKNEAPPSASTSPTTATPLFAMPVDGEILKDYAENDLVFSATMNDWRTHCGIDIAAAENDDVKAAADGTVERVYEDGMLGNCVVIAHSDGLKTIYANLAAGSEISEGTNVKTGEIVGKVGKTSALEISDPIHIHFEVLLDGKNKNPADYLQIESENANN